MRALAQNRGSEASGLQLKTSTEVRNTLLERQEIALLDVREEAFHAEGHPLFAANLPLSRVELDAPARLPRRSVPIVLFDDGKGHSSIAAERLAALGYTDISILDGGLEGWRDAGFEIFRDVNSPSKAFGELVEATRHTPSLSAQEVKHLIETNADIMIVDARRYEEFQTMSIPTAISAPGGELVYRLQGLSGQPSTHVIVNCAGRTRGIIGTQSLINSGLPNRVTALRNGTIGWKLAQQVLDHGATREAPIPDELSRARAATVARQVADAAKVCRISFKEVKERRLSAAHTTYLFDVRSPGEYAAGHLPNFLSAPGGQLVQETDMFAPIRGAQLILADDDGARANMSASWLAQMNWEVYVVDGLNKEDFTAEKREDQSPYQHEIPADSKISAATLHSWIQHGKICASDVIVLDFSRSRDYRKDHIPGSQFALRSRMEEALQTTVESKVYVVTAHEEAAACLAWKELATSTNKPTYLLVGDTKTWRSSGYPLDSSRMEFASQPVDYYHRPYEGTEISAASMQAYLDWEFSLIEQLKRDGTHGFWVLERSNA
jgi:rhodanese-related sulfurtransferase